MKRTTRRRLEFARTIALGGLIPGWGPVIAMRHAERWPVDASGRHHGPVRKRR